MANESLAEYYGFTVGDDFGSTFSVVSIESIIFFIVASAIGVLELLFDSFKNLVNSWLDERLVHDADWYARMAKDFQYGYEVENSKTPYSTIDEDAKIVSYAAVSESNRIVQMKVARSVDGGLSKLLSGADGDQLERFTEYVGRRRDFGVEVNVISTNGDDLRAVIDVWYDPQVLNGEGKLLSDSSKEPARDAVKEFIKNLPFDGVFIPTHMIDAMQEAQGVKIPALLSCETRYEENDFASVDGKVTPYGGYLTVTDENLTLNYRAYAN